jgi:hypothetical protein
MRVSEIVITPRDPSFLALPQRLRPLARAVGLHHTTTKPDVIGRFMLLEVGGPCTEERRAETERILRLQPFLADATVRAVASPLGGARIEVETVDEIPTVFGVRLDGVLPSAIRFGNGNVGGQGLHLAARVERGFAYRNGVGVEATAHQAFGRPYTLSLVAERAPLGSTLSVALGHSFLTDLHRTAWHVGFRDVTQYVSFTPPEGDPLSLEVERRLWSGGGVRRIGLGRQSAFIGVLVTAEAVRTGSPGVVADSGFAADTTGALGGPLPSYRNMRLNAVLGVRSLSFLAGRGFDALTAVQDLATGLQLGAVLGQGVPRVGDLDDDRFVAVDLYAGRASGTALVALWLRGEARWDTRSDRWDSMIGSGRMAWYIKPSPDHVLVGSAEFAGGQRPRVPFQLMLGDREGGVRGYAAARLGGAARTVFRLEERWSIGGLTRHAEVGLSGFADAGWVWAGDAQFGTDSRLKVGVGVGLLAAFPPQSPRLWRLDVAVPVSADPHARWEVRLSSSWTRSPWREPDDVARTRAGAAASRIFRWP